MLQVAEQLGHLKKYGCMDVLTQGMTSRASTPAIQQVICHTLLGMRAGVLCPAGSNIERRSLYIVVVVIPLPLSV